MFYLDQENACVALGSQERPGTRTTLTGEPALAEDLQTGHPICLLEAVARSRACGLTTRRCGGGSRIRSRRGACWGLDVGDTSSGRVASHCQRGLAQQSVHKVITERSQLRSVVAICCCERRNVQGPQHPRQVWR